MTAADKLLPKEAGPLEKAAAYAVSAELPKPIRESMTPATAPEDFLGPLAAHESVDLWYPDWPEDRKRKMIEEAPYLASIVGTRSAAAKFLDYVDAEIIHEVSHPARQPIGSYAIGIHPIRHKELLSRYLVKVDLKVSDFAFCIGRSAIGLAAILPPDLEPQDRAMEALAASKGDATEYSVTFAHRQPITLADGLDLSGEDGYIFGSFKDRQRI